MFCVKLGTSLFLWFLISVFVYEFFVISNMKSLPKQPHSSFRSLKRDGLLSGLDDNSDVDRFPKDFQVEFLVSILPRITDTLKFAFAWLQENADNLSCQTSIELLIQHCRSRKFRPNVEPAESLLISKQLRNILTAISEAIIANMSLSQPANSATRSECWSMMHSSQLHSSTIECLLIELPMAIFERDTIFHDGKRYVPRARGSPISNCTEHTVAGRFVASMISTLFLLHQRVFIDLPLLDVMLSRVAGISKIIVLSSFASAQDFHINDASAVFPLNFQESARLHHVEGLLFYTYGYYFPPPARMTHLHLHDVFQWNCLEYSPLARDPDSFCRSLIAGEICKRGYSVYNIDPDSVFLRDINREQGFYGHLSMANYYFTNEEMWLNYSFHVGRMNNFGQWFLQARSPFSVPWSFFVHLLATDLLTTSSGPHWHIDDVVNRYTALKMANRDSLSLLLGPNTQCGDDQHVFNDFFNFFAEDKNARFLRSVRRRNEAVLSQSPMAFLDFRILTGRENAMAISYCRGVIPDGTVTVHLTSHGPRQHKPSCLREQGGWYLDSLDDMAMFRGRFVALDEHWFGKLITRFHEGRAAQWLICYARKHNLIPVLPTLRCSWTAAAHGWTLKDRCSWYMRYAYPGDAGSYRENSFLSKFDTLSKANISFTLHHFLLNRGLMLDDFRSGSMGSLIIMSPQFWRETRWNRVIREWLPSFFHYLVPLEDAVPDVSACAPLTENPRPGSCC